mgnify:CR=1 FL=1
MQPYLEILFFFIAGFTFPIVNVLLSRLLRRDRPYPEKGKPYESGMEPYGDARVPFHLAYYAFALLFVVFDVETVFMYPWAVAFRDIGPAFAFWEMFVFLAILAVGLVYAWKKKALRWI